MQYFPSRISATARRHDISVGILLSLRLRHQRRRAQLVLRQFEHARLPGAGSDGKNPKQPAALNADSTPILKHAPENVAGAHPEGHPFADAVVVRDRGSHIHKRITTAACLPLSRGGPRPPCRTLGRGRRTFGANPELHSRRLRPESLPGSACRSSDGLSRSATR